LQPLQNAIPSFFEGCSHRNDAIERCKRIQAVEP
jgi:hypothetical protein